MYLVGRFEEALKAQQGLVSGADVLMPGALPHRDGYAFRADPLAVIGLKPNREMSPRQLP